MSADNWVVCPRCRDRAAAERAALIDEAAAAYGNVPVSEYEALRARAQEPGEPLKATFSEYYEFYGAEDGTIAASYNGECQVCGLKAAMRHSVKFYEKEP